jgi:hypothetical protein
MDMEAKLEKMGIRKIQSSWATWSMFMPPLFDRDPSGDNDPSNERRYHGYPFSFSISGPDSKVSEPDWRYRQLLRLLKEFDDTELRWLLLARWLSEESICEPDEFLPPAILESLIKRYKAQTAKLSERDCLVWNLISIWHLYFSELQVAARKLPKRLRDHQQALAKLGFDPAAVHWILGTRSLVPAITRWLEERGKGDARSLENAYSRGQSSRRRIQPDL